MVLKLSGSSGWRWRERYKTLPEYVREESSLQKECTCVQYCVQSQEFHRLLFKIVHEAQVNKKSQSKTV